MHSSSALSWPYAFVMGAGWTVPLSHVGQEVFHPLVSISLYDTVSVPKQEKDFQILL